MSRVKTLTTTGPANLDPFPVTATYRDAEQQGSPIYVTSEGLELIERAAAQGFTDTAISSLLRVDRATFRAMRERQPAVDEALARGRSVLDAELTHHLLEASRKGEWRAAAELGARRLGWREGEAAGAKGVADLPAPPMREASSTENMTLRDILAKLDERGLAAYEIVIAQLNGDPEPGDWDVVPTGRRRGDPKPLAEDRQLTRKEES